MLEGTRLIPVAITAFAGDLLYSWDYSDGIMIDIPLEDADFLPAAVLDRFPAMLSGGEQQRAAIARALGMETRLLLADEPTGNLDTANSQRIFAVLSDLAHRDGYCVIIVTHDEAICEQADELLRLRDGRLE